MSLIPAVLRRGGRDKTLIVRLNRGTTEFPRSLVPSFPRSLVPSFPTSPFHPPRDGQSTFLTAVAAGREFSGRGMAPQRDGAGATGVHRLSSLSLHSPLSGWEARKLRVCMAHLSRGFINFHEELYELYIERLGARRGYVIVLVVLDIQRHVI